MKHNILLTILVLLAACSPQAKEYGEHAQWLKAGENLIYCHSDTNIPNDLLYYQSAQVVNQIEVPQNVADSFKSYYITDVLGQVYSINSNEIPNYKCYLVEKNEKR